MELLVNSRYKLLCRLGDGSYGQVWKATDCHTNMTVAVKLESANAHLNLLESEYRTYEALQPMQGIPRVFWYGVECEYRAMAFELLGPSLEDLFQYCHGKFSLKTVLMLANQTIARLEDLHSRDIIHRDISPSNILMGEGTRWHQVYFVDLGLSTSDYSRNARQDSHMVGTLNYASIAAHSGSEQTPCDDLESLGYVLVSFLKGQLPWEAINLQDQNELRRRVFEMKKNTTEEKLCEDLPQEFADYFRCVRSAKPADYKQLYRRLRRMFDRLYTAKGYKHDNIFDFTVLLYRTENP